MGVAPMHMYVNSYMKWLPVPLPVSQKVLQASTDEEWQHFEFMHGNHPDEYMFEY